MDTNYYLNRYGGYADIHLPKSYRVYFDSYSDEYKQYPIEKKLLDLAYVIIHGFDVKRAIKTFLDTHVHVSKRDIQRAVWSLAAAANHVKSIPDRKNTLETDVDILIEDLLRYYRLPLDNSIPHFLEEDFRMVTEQTVYRSNGWELAAENINQYQMYKEDDFVFYPADAELLQKYHQKDIDSGNIGQIFPVGPCPEPWYGNPMTANIIILGDMPRNDDFIDRCANIILSFEPRLMEEVQIMVRRWMSMEGEGIYNSAEFRQSGICVGDAYNSVTYRHWIYELRNLAYILKVEEQDLLNRVCVINANAYYASGGHDPLAAGLLPSQYYLRVLINYLVNNKNGEKPLFIIPSIYIHKIWKKILGYWIENDIMQSLDVILIDRPNTKLKLNPDLISKESIMKILKRIK